MILSWFAWIEGCQADMCTNLQCYRFWNGWLFMMTDFVIGASPCPTGSMGSWNSNFASGSSTSCCRLQPRSLVCMLCKLRIKPRIKVVKLPFWMVSVTIIIIVLATLLSFVLDNCCGRFQSLLWSMWFVIMPFVQTSSIQSGAVFGAVLQASPQSL